MAHSPQLIRKNLKKPGWRRNNLLPGAKKEKKKKSKKMKKNLSYTELDRYTEIKNGFGEDKSDCCFGGGSPLWLIDRGDITEKQNFDERRH